MVTLKDFIELDSSICGLDIDVRKNGSQLVEIHRFGEGAWPGNDRTKVEENVYLEIMQPKVYIYLHKEPINTIQTDKDYWSVIKNQIPKKLLDMPVCRIAPYTAAFWPKKQNGQYYSIDLRLDDPDSYETPVMKPKEETDNISIDELLEVTNGSDDDI
jgi:hypothetical protein